MSVFSTVYPQSYPSRKSISQDPSTDGTLASRRATKQRPLDEAAAVLNRSVPQATRKSKTHDYLAARELHTSSGAICSSRRSLSSSSQAPSPSNSASFEARRSKLALTRATSCSDMAPAASKGACPTVGKAENVRSRYQGGSRCEQAQSASGLKTKYVAPASLGEAATRWRRRCRRFRSRRTGRLAGRSTYKYVPGGSKNSARWEERVDGELLGAKAQKQP